MKLISHLSNEIPMNINFHYGDSYDTETVLGKLKTGEVFTIYAKVSSEDMKVTWYYTGRDGYILKEEDLECWAYIPDFNEPLF